MNLQHGSSHQLFHSSNFLKSRKFSRLKVPSVVFQDREFVEMEVPYNGAPKRPGSPSPLTSPAHSTASRGGLLQSCCGRCYPQRYQVRGRRILASNTSINETAPSSSSHSHQSQPGRLHYQPAPVDPTTIPNVVFNVPGDADRQRRQGASSSSPYNETRVWARVRTVDAILIIRRQNRFSESIAEYETHRNATQQSPSSNCGLSIGILVLRKCWLFLSSS